ncbi:DEAD/DEAH box helicase [Pedobacter chitinilyticus]|uniref:DEAD-box ATP-dependent RNA helicase RhpA n=1 Tax=Pedobacter chitinilyticus TaxID=2233776 RepID=A0A443YWS6_9SPHI|nr:DEAD/DEAH box helicase [Pedobacter chitinilyticus]RWU08426.1 DEAD/DEAH box helicase [Pedobacter chitinilyticus]
MLFSQLRLIEPILKAVESEGYQNPTPIQQKAIPSILKLKDLLGCAQTGTGKTAAFAIPMLQILHMRHLKTNKKAIKALVLTPTRELAIQIQESFSVYGKNLPVKNAVIFGGVGQQPQVDALRKGVDVLVATPGRLLDLMGQGHVNLSELEIFVLDEADRMLDMGFINDVKKVVAKLPQKRQTLFFSATMPPEIEKLANTILKDPVTVEVTPVSSTADTIKQSIYFVDKPDKRKLLKHLLDELKINHTLIFTRTKHGADRIARDLIKDGVKAAAIHGDKSQGARQRALTEFKDRTLRVLVATDIAARGIDIDDLTYVFNYDLPNVPETYVHRIGRTGRAGANGNAISFVDAEENEYLISIHKLIKKVIPIVEDHPYPLSWKSMLAGKEVQRKPQKDSKGNKEGAQSKKKKFHKSRR